MLRELLNPHPGIIILCAWGIACVFIAWGVCLWAERQGRQP